MTKTIKQIITEAVLKQLPDNVCSYDEAMKKWWMNIRSNSGLRLSDVGVLAFKMADIEYYEYELKIDPNVSWYNFILDLNKKIKCPYYLGIDKISKPNKPYIRLYDSKIAMMISLYGDLHSYLNSIKVRK